MKNLKTVIIIVLVLTVAVGLYFMINDIVEKNRPVNPAITEMIAPSNVKSDDIVRYVFKVKNEQTAVELMDVTVKDEEGNETIESQFRLSNEPERELNTNITTALVQAASLVCLDIIEENPKDISKYGIDYQSYFEVGLKDGSSYTVYFGDVVPVTYNVYVMREGVDKIYTISDTSFAMLTIYREYLLSDVIFPGSASTLSTFTLYKKDVLEFTVQPDQYVNWKLTEPLSAKTYDQTVQEMIDDTYRILIGEYVNVLPSEQDYKDYGLYLPEYTVKVKADAKTVTLHLGRYSIENKSYYAKFDKDVEVFYVSDNYLGWIDSALMEIMYPIPYEPPVQNVASIKYTFSSGEDYKMEMSEKEYIMDERPVTNYEYVINGELVDLQYGFDVYLSTFYGTVIVEVDNEWEGPFEFTQPYLELELEYTSGNLEKIAYYIRNDDTMYYVRYNPESPLIDQYTGAVVDSGPISEFIKAILGKYPDYLYERCVDGKEHDFADWVVITEPTETEKGLKEATCKVCGYKISAPIPVIKPIDPGEYKESYWWVYVLAALSVGSGIAAVFAVKKKKEKDAMELKK